jgi:hypothetical protein
MNIIEGFASIASLSTLGAVPLEPDSGAGTERAPLLGQAPQNSPFQSLCGFNRRQIAIDSALFYPHARPWREREKSPIRAGRLPSYYNRRLTSLRRILYRVDHERRR